MHLPRAVLGAEDKLAAFDQYLIWGGIPLAVTENGEQARTSYLSGLFGEVYVSDIRKHNRFRDDYVWSG